jgi:hypothetical protein
VTRPRRVLAMGGALVLASALAPGAAQTPSAEPAARPLAPAATPPAPSPAGGAASEPGTPPDKPDAPARIGAVSIEAIADRKTVTVGDPITVTVRLVHPPDVRVTSFDPEVSLGDLAPLARPWAGTKKLPDGRVEETRVLKVARYRIGASRVPSFEATFVDAKGKENKVATPPVPFTVGSILSEGDVRPADLKSPAVMATTPIWPWVAAAVAAAALVALWLWRRRKRRAVPHVTTPAAPQRPAHEIAYAELERLLSSGLLEAGRVKEFYIELVEIVRRYLAARFGVDTFERTSAEILESLRLARLPAKGLALTSEFFGACDVVKFAKYVPSSDETRNTVERAYRLIDETRARESAPDPAVTLAAGAGR